MKNFIKSNISQESLALLLTQAPVALSMLMGDEFIIQVANPQILHLWGKTPQIIGRKLIDALPELEGQPFMDILSQVRTTGKPYKGYKEFCYLVRNGKREECYFDFIYAPIFNDEETEIIGVSVELQKLQIRLTPKKNWLKQNILLKDLLKNQIILLRCTKARILSSILPITAC